LALVAFILLTAGNAYFVIAEYSLVTVDRALIERQAAEGDRRAKQVSAALKQLSFQLSGAQLGITVTALLTGYLAQPAIAHLLEPVLTLVGLPEVAVDVVAAAIGLIIATLFTMLFGELIPKNAAFAMPLPLAKFAAAGQRAFSATLKPLILLLNGTANALVRLIGIEPQEELASARSPEELGLLAVISARAGALPDETATLLQRSIRFGDKRAAEAMTPRVDVVGLQVEATVSDVLTLALESGHTRFPLYRDTIDTVVAVVSATEALRVPSLRRRVTKATTVAEEPVLVPESLDLDKVFRRLHGAGKQLAIVVDEYGGTDGIITTEDLAEELIGEIADEYDVDEEDSVPDTATTNSATVTTPLADRSVLVDGLLRTDEMHEQTGFALPDGPFETLAGFLMARLGHIPVEGELVTENGWEFTVTEVERHRIEQVRVNPPDNGDNGATEEGRK
jgi:CBS domain containing-hemolysin-like protein